jgi:hypothetical protein
MTGPRDPRDATSVGHPDPIALPTAERLDGVTLGVPDDLTGEGVEPGVMEAFEAALEVARGLGARVERVALPHADFGLSAYYVLAPAECSSNLARFDGVRYGRRAPDAADLVSLYTQTRHDGFGTRSSAGSCSGPTRCRRATTTPTTARPARAHEDLRRLRGAFREVDLVVTPTSPGVAFPLGDKTGDPLSMYLNDYFTVPMSLAGIPAVSLPCGLSERLPVGLQLAGPPSRRTGSSTRARARARLRLRRDGGVVVSTQDGVRDGHRAGDPRPARHAHEDVLLLRARASASRRTPARAPLPRAAGPLPVATREAIHHGLMIGWRSAASWRRGRSSPQELLLSRPAQGLPDLQYDEPLCRGGELGGVRIHRVHLEEDAAKTSTRVERGGSPARRPPW